MNTKTIRLPSYWEEKLEETADREDESFSEVVRRRTRFGLSKLEYRNLENLAKEQDIAETEVVEQGIKFMSVIMDPDLSFSEAIKTFPEMASIIQEKKEERVREVSDQ